MNANNTYFENLKCLGHEYEERRAAHESRKQHMKSMRTKEGGAARGG